MFYINATLESWVLKYGLTPKKYTCPSCKKECITDQPFITKDHVGLIGESCYCGETQQRIICKPKSVQKQMELQEAFESYMND